VLVIITLSIAGQVGINVYINSSQSDARVINISGAQRMLSQLITKDVLAILPHALRPTRTPTPRETYYVDELTNQLPVWEQSQAALINGSRRPPGNAQDERTRMRVPLIFNATQDRLYAKRRKAPRRRVPVVRVDRLLPRLGGGRC